MKKFLSILSIAILVSAIFIGCTSFFDHDGFSDEEYIWENWSISTNSINIIEVKF